MKKLIIANWKMNPSSIKEAEVLFVETSLSLKGLKNIDVVICPPSPFLFLPMKSKIKNLKIGAQDVFFEKEGSYTGEISTRILKNFNVQYVLLGHSERRAMGETNEIINKKILAVLKSQMLPIFCIGEKERDHNGFYLSFIKQQLTEGLTGVQKSQMKNIIIAYEPIWAIGDNASRVATHTEFTEIRIFIKKIISDIFDMKIANDVQIVYGGSVDPSNAESFIKEGEAGGLLIGRSSLKPKKFKEIIDLSVNKK